MHLKAFQQRGQVLELSLQVEKPRHAVEISAQDQWTTQVGKSLALKGKFLIPVSMAQLLGHASCRKASLYLLHVSLIRTSASLVSGPLNLDLFFVSASQKQAKRFSSTIHHFCSAQWFPVLVYALGLFFFPHCLQLVNILIDTVDKCQKTSLHNRNSRCLRSV